MKWGFPFSVNFILWGFIGWLRYFTEEGSGLRKRPADSGIDEWKYVTLRKNVAICLAAKNEARVIQKSIKSLTHLVPPQQCFIVSDGSTDETASIARRNGCRVLELSPSHGKGKALEKLLHHFRLLQRFQFVVIVDADTRLSRHYLLNAFRLFEDPKVACVAAYAKVQWRNHSWPQWKYFFSAYYTRLFRILQLFLMFGQSWRYTNVLTVVPGFAAMYRARVLKKLELHVPGLAQEDFNLAFQIHKKKLGRIAHHPSVVATSQEPDNLRDYYKQVRRWNLGFYQTARYNGIWPSLFWFSILLFTAEVFLAAAFFLFLPVLALFLVLDGFYPTLVNDQFFIIAGLRLTIWDIAILILLFDYLFTVFVALRDKKPIMLFYGLGFIFLRILDSLNLFLSAPVGLLTKSSGVWVSPKRY